LVKLSKRKNSPAHIGALAHNKPFATAGWPVRSPGQAVR